MSNILVVEDDEDILELVDYNLAKNGYSVTCVTEGEAGLGLAIAKHIAKVHKATISVESEPDKGSTFSIHLPTGPFTS